MVKVVDNDIWPRTEVTRGTSCPASSCCSSCYGPKTQVLWRSCLRQTSRESSPTQPFLHLQHPSYPDLQWKPPILNSTPYHTTVSPTTFQWTHHPPPLLLPHAGSPSPQTQTTPPTISQTSFPKSTSTHHPAPAPTPSPPPGPPSHAKTPPAPLSAPPTLPFGQGMLPMPRFPLALRRLRLNPR